MEAGEKAHQTRGTEGGIPAAARPRGEEEKEEEEKEEEEVEEEE